MSDENKTGGWSRIFEGVVTFSAAVSAAATVAAAWYVSTQIGLMRESNALTRQALESGRQQLEVTRALERARIVFEHVDPLEPSGKTPGRFSVTAHIKNIGRVDATKIEIWNAPVIGDKDSYQRILWFQPRSQPFAALAAGQEGHYFTHYFDVPRRTIEAENSPVAETLFLYFALSYDDPLGPRKETLCFEWSAPRSWLRCKEPPSPEPHSPHPGPEPSKLAPPTPTEARKGLTGPNR